MRIRQRLGISPDRIGAAVHLFARAHTDAFFIQIGANDGFARDPLRIEIERRQWRGIMVEPVPYVFRRLEERYGAHPGIILEQAAIADRDGAFPFYHLREAAPGEDVWHWYHALGSFKRDVVLGHKDLVPDIEARLVETRITSLSFESLCRKHHVDEIDLLQIDTEGHDYEILRSMDLNAWRPRLIIYEHHHLSADDRAAARDLLTQHGYLSFEHGLDTAALHATNVRDRSLRALFERTPDEPAQR